MPVIITPWPSACRDVRHYTRSVDHATPSREAPVLALRRLVAQLAPAAVCHQYAAAGPESASFTLKAPAFLATPPRGSVAMSSSAQTSRLPADATEQEAASRRLREAFATAADALASPMLAGQRDETSWSVLDTAVADYVALCKAEGLPPERALVRLDEVTRRHELAAQHGGREELCAMVFRAFLRAYYERDDGRFAPR
jgi:hypothetical protein